MPFLFLYLLKVAVSLAVVYLFYQLLLRRLTFYNWNRFYLLGYSALSFLIPFIDLTRIVGEEELTTVHFIQWVPVLRPDISAGVSTDPVATFDPWFLVSILLLSGLIIMVLRLIVQLLSFRKMKSGARLLEDGSVRIYEISGDVIPFSFGRSIFVNPALHSTGELREIIRHEFVHVKQRHTVDIIFGEVLCLLCWFNPFAWLIRNAIRQNLEFIADRQVIDRGLDRRQYQYLLLKVIGSEHFRIASKFNFSSLKKRIAMMNKMKSTGVHLLKFLFLLPVVAVLLLAFRNQNEVIPGTASVINGTVNDTVAPAPINSKGFYLDVVGVKGECFVVVKDANRRELERVSLNTWKETRAYNEKYGEIPPPPPPQPPSVTEVSPAVPVPPVPPVPGYNNNCAPANAVAVSGTALPEKIKNSSLVKEFEITDSKATMQMKDGSVEHYDLTDETQKANFEKKYGKVYQSRTPAPVIYASGTGQGVTAVTPIPPGTAPGATTVPSTSNIITGAEDIIITISNTTTREQLNGFIQQMKEKGIDLHFSNVDFNDGKITSLSGYMKKKGSRSDFTVTDFKTVTLAMIEKDGQVWLKVSTREEKIVI